MYLKFGKYQGYHISEVPSTYLAYALEEFTLKDELEAAIRGELAERFSAYAPLPPPNIKEAYRQLAKKYHPDLGGSLVAMQAINEFYELISK